MLGKVSKSFKITFVLVSLVAVTLAMFLTLYLYILPKAVSSSMLHEKVNNILYETLGARYNIENPSLKTGLHTSIAFKTDKFELLKGNDKLIVVNNINTKFSFAQIFLKKLKVNTLGADYIYADVNKILSLVPEQQEKKETKTDWFVDFYDSLLYVKNLKILYSLDDGTKFDVNAKNISIDNAQKKCKFVHFDILTQMKKNSEKITIAIADENKVYIKKKCLFVDKCKLKVNNSVINIDAQLKRKHHNIEVSSNRFEVKHVIDLVKTNLIIPNGAELLTMFDDIKGNFDFRLRYRDNKFNGNVNVNKMSLIFVPINNVPVQVHKGVIDIDTKNIALKDFEGYYGTRKVNCLKLNGTIKDYIKTFDTNIVADAIVTDDFAKYYLTEMIGYPMNIIGKADTKLIIKSLKGVTDLLWLFKIEPECNLLVGGEPLSKYKLKRVLVSKMQIVNTLLHINSMDYYVSVPNNEKFNRRRILSLNGVIDFANGGVNFKEMGFDVTEPMPGEFLNVIIRQEFFKKGTIIGKLKAIEGPKGVKLFGDVNLEKMFVPSQRLFIKQGKLVTDFNNIKINSTGKYRRSDFKLDGSFANNIAFPIIVNNIELSIDSLDIDRLLKSFNQQGASAENKPTPAKSDSTDDEAITFDLANLIIKKCTFNLDKGSYKLIDFGNLHANMSLDENSVLKLDSNRFDFAKGHSSCHVNCDLKNSKYNIKLGAKDVDSDIIATSLLNLKKEISGKASGIIDLYTDKTLKMNGNIKFIVKDGTIGKVGLIEYILKFASIFRNPLAMISPATIFDLMNIPDGNFDKIDGNIMIKNNVVEQIKIRSSAPQLSAYIAGRYDIENSDAALRIYTKLSNKNKGIYGVLRNLSLSSIASRVSLGGRNDSNYYSSELSELPAIEADDRDCQIFLTRIDGDVEHNNFISSLKKLK